LIGAGSENPYLKEFSQVFGHRSPYDDSFWGDRHFFSQWENRHSERLTFRHRAVENYAWAVPDERAINVIAKHSPLIEIGAGTGYWAWLLRQRGADILAYDKRGENEVVIQWTEVLKGTPTELQHHPDRTLFLCWPPYDDAMAYDCLVAYQGRCLIYVGEGAGGCTGDEAFHDELERGWEETEEYNIPQHWGMHDRLTIWRRKEKTP
jgi:hypothetical protein